MLKKAMIGTGMVCALAVLAVVAQGHASLVAQAFRPAPGSPEGLRYEDRKDADSH